MMCFLVTKATAPWVLLLLLQLQNQITVVQAAYWQHDEGPYLADFQNHHLPNSYTALENEFPDLKNRCRGNGLGPPPTRTVSIQFPSTIYASSDEWQATSCGQNDICVIETGVTLIMDTSLILGALIIKGGLVWNDSSQSNQDQYLCAGYMVVEGNGRFELSLASPQQKAWIYLRNNGAIHPALRSRVLGSFASGYNDNPLLEIQGRPMLRTWSLLSDSLPQGSATIKLLHNAHIMGWVVGDRIAIAPIVPLAKGWGQEFTIAQIYNDGSIRLDRPSDQTYDVLFEVVGSVNQVSMKTPEVINLSRNVIITGDDFEHVPCDPNLPEAIAGESTSTQGCRCGGGRTKCTVGLHTMQSNGGIQKIHNVRVEKCGQRGIEGKYCLHLHQVGACPECSFQNNAVEFSQQRGIIIHGTHLSKVQGNVLYNVRGAGVYIEDGNEMQNRLAYNVVICPYPFNDESFHGCTVPGTSNRLSDTRDNQSSFFSLAASNDMIGNRGVNSFNGMFLKEGGQGRGMAFGKVCESASALGRYEGNTFHSCGRFGTYALGFNYPKLTDQSVQTNGFHVDQSQCQGFDEFGNTRGVPASFTGHSDYGNAFVGHYMAGDLQYNEHISTDSLNLLYWKETKTFDNGCAAHITNSYYARGRVALPDHGTFLIENTVFGNGVQLETNHHCDVGETGVLCMPTYMFHKVAWQNKATDKTWVHFFNNGGIFTLSPEETKRVQNGEILPDAFFPPGYVSLASQKFEYLLQLPGKICVRSQEERGGLYHDGILCKVPLRVLRIYTSSPSSQLKLDVWWNKANGVRGQNGSPTATQYVNYHRSGASSRQGFAVPVISGTSHSYKISIAGGPLPKDWVIEFSDPVVGNRWTPDYLYLSVVGRPSCGVDGLVNSQHDRSFIWSGDEFMADEAWGNHGACVGSGVQPNDQPQVDCSDPQQNKYGLNELVRPTDCPESCGYACDSSTSYCDCATSTCKCNAGFTGSNCEIDLCGDAGCGEHGRCTALYLGVSGELPVSSDKACICEPGWTGLRCDSNPCIYQGRTCSGHGTCIAVGNLETQCECDPGFSGDDCESSCDGFCPGTFPYGCISDSPGKAALGCARNGLCWYLNEGESYPHENFCTYKSYTRDSSPPLPSPHTPQTLHPTPYPTPFPAPFATPSPPPTSNRLPPTPSPTAQLSMPTGSPDNLTYKGNNGNPRTAFPLTKCEGDCDGDSDCQGSLKCFERTGTEAVPGCNGGGFYGIDYCYEEAVIAPATAAPQTKPPTFRPTPGPTEPPVTNEFYCGCTTCTSDVYNADASGHSCGARMEWLVSHGYATNDLEACGIVSDEFPSICGPKCHPTKCEITTPSPPENPSCESICSGSYPFSCAESVPGAVKYGCYRGGGCYYPNSLEQLYPYDQEGWCTYKTESNRRLRGAGGSSE
ncbi:unnamed protein product [Cylindrotheca closterium]|uniref:EGF-like domain-containing protein n=1 Tax=Cylindrotheca closterium TaxID=2856 RepID=A0AAD2CNE9_9STRA|nr:unnamed protein product [Cylindrotheca closterium]